jgi:Cu2+-exporting ATPase
MQLSPETVVATATSVETITLDVAGMKCAGCISVVERQLGQHPGVVAARVQFGN